MGELYKKLGAVQQELKAPKAQFNSFGGYAYRSCEDILEAVKPLLKKNGLVLLMSDEMISVGGRCYVTAKATLIDPDDLSDAIIVSASAREDEGKKGMDGSQITGAASSYARKYALNGLFLIDDTKDADATNTHGKDADARPTANRAGAPVNVSAGNFDPVCATCGADISVAEHDYSVKRYKRPLCRSCQKKEK